MQELVGLTAKIILHYQFLFLHYCSLDTEQATKMLTVKKSFVDEEVIIIFIKILYSLIF